MVEQDYYELLGVPRAADDAAIKAAYRKLAKEHHPDRKNGCKESEARIKAINEAYHVLKDPQKRAAYDRFGHAAFRNGGSGDPFADVARLHPARIVTRGPGWQRAVATGYDPTPQRLPEPSRSALWRIRPT